MAQTVVQMIEDRFQRGIAAQRSTWSLLGSTTQALDVVNHVLRVVIQLGHIDEYIPEFEMLAFCQHNDGGWADLSSGKRSGIRNTCFAARNIIRANRVLRRADFAAVTERAVRFVIAQQNTDGFWSDAAWGRCDATSSSMGLLLYAIKESWGISTQEIHQATKNGLEHAETYLKRSQAADGWWQDVRTHETPIGSTGHLLPKLVLFRGEQTSTVKMAIDFLGRSQEEDGSWDHQDTDHTCDAVRALLLTYSIISRSDLPPVIERGIDWLVKNENPDGFWGEHPGKESSQLIICDVLDCFSKYGAYRQSLNLRAFWE